MSRRISCGVGAARKGYSRETIASTLASREIVRRKSTRRHNAEIATEVPSSISQKAKAGPALALSKVNRLVPGPGSITERALEHDDLGADGDAAVELDHIFVAHAEAA